MPVKKKNPNNILLTIMAILLLVLFILKFDVVTSAIDPTGKMGLAGIVNDSFPIVLGVVLIIIGIAAAATVWVAVALVAVGVGMVASRLYSIWKRNQKTTLNTPG
ncbi:hypothetical protein LCGC14_1723370 [marine sediment metagenome]|uniref:Uncharacterized protein n=1 Tax=marine sediment metagenome TaxID=412755 RepID=A0A0F9HZG4_9ZZZZ